jgi:dipeptidyl aminopeptidase/acylaminoacyl peptidase
VNNAFVIRLLLAAALTSGCLEAQKNLQSHGGLPEAPSRVALSPEGNQLAWSISDQGKMVLRVDDLKESHASVIVSPNRNANDQCSSDTPVWSRDGRNLAFTAICDSKGAVKGETHQRQIYIWNKETDTVRQVTNMVGGISDVAWSFDNSAVLFLFIQNATREPGEVEAERPLAGVIGQDDLEISRVYSVDVSSGHGDFVTPPTLHVFQFVPSPRSLQVAFFASPPPGEESWSLAKLFVQDVPRSGTNATADQTRVLIDSARLVGPLKGAQMTVPSWSPDGKRIAFLCGLMTDPVAYGGDICMVEANNKESAPVDVTPGIDGSARFAQWHDSDTVSFVEDRRGHTLLVNWDVGKRQAVRGQAFDLGENTVNGGPAGPAAPAVDGISYSPANDSAGFVMQGHDLAPEVYTVHDHVLHQFTHLNDTLKPPTHTISIEWENEGNHIQGWLTFPEGYDPSRSYPLLVEPHGGPAWNIGSRWDGDPWGGINSYWAHLGYFFFLPNPRGSYGQGEAFVQGNRKDLGYGDLRDVLKGVDVLEERFPIDKRREGLLGWSYGGFMTMFGVTQTQRFRAAVAGPGVSDWISYYGTSAFTDFTLPLFGASAYEAPELYARSSAIMFIVHAKTPTLLLVGDRDGACPAPQSLEFWHALRHVKTPTQLVVYPNEGHHFSAKDNNDALKRAAEWFARYMPAS